MRKLSLTRDAARVISRLDAKQFKQVAGKVFDLMRDPSPPDSEHMKGFDGRRADIGEFRIVYRYDRETVYIEAVGKRNDDEVYRRLR